MLSRPAEADQIVRDAVAGERVRARAAVDVLDVAAHVVALTRLAVVADPVQADVDAARAVGVGDTVLPGATVERVGAVRHVVLDERVIALAGPDQANRLYVIAERNRTRDEFAPTEPVRNGRALLAAALTRRRAEELALDQLGRGGTLIEASSADSEDGSEDRRPSLTYKPTIRRQR